MLIQSLTVLVIEFNAVGPATENTSDRDVDTETLSGKLHNDVLAM